MNPFVRWLFTTDTNQQRPALCVVHADQALCVQAGSIVRVIVRTQKEFAGMRTVVKNGDLYPADKAAANLRTIGQRIGITKQAELLLLAIEDNDDASLAGVTFIDEEGKTMRDETDLDDTEGGEDETAAPAVVKKKKLPPPRVAAPSPGAFTRKAKTVAAPAATKETKKTVTTPVKGTKETTVAAKKTVKAKAKAKGKAKVVAKKAAAAPGEGGFRSGSNMEKGFILYKAARKDYIGMERGDKQVWAQKTADKLNTTLNSVRTMISKNWEPLLTK
jgi:hypothetical protein